MKKILSAFILFAFVSCKKDKNSPSENAVYYSIDNGRIKKTELTSSYTNRFIDSPLNIFFETYGDYRAGQASEVSIDLSYDQNLLVSSLPYTTDKFFIYIRDNQDGQLSGMVLPYTYHNNPPEPNTYRNGDLKVTITEIKNKRIKGVIKGTIYRMDNGSIPNPNNLDCRFDIDLSK